MSLGCLAELVSVTNEAVKSLNSVNNNKSESNNASNTVHIFSAGSPFESPRSFQSVSVKSGNSNVELDNTQPSSKPPSCEFSESKEIPDCDNKINLLGVNGESVSVIGITERTVIGSSSETQHSGNNDNINNIVNNNDQKISISKTRLREVPSPREHTRDHHSPRSQSSVSSVGSKIVGEQNETLPPAVARSTETVFVQRHGPNAQVKNFNSNKVLVTKIDFKQAVTSLSTLGEQPEIIDVHQRVATITSGMSQSSDDSAEDLYSHAHKMPGSGQSRGSNHILPGKNELGHGLRQGSLNRGIVDPSKVSLFNDVYISHFGLTEKQRGLKEALAKRSESNRPTKKFVQPQILRKTLLSDSETDRSRNHHPSNAQTASSATDPVVTAAAAASAAVAAAQPFLKTQHELETRMQQLLAQISELQQRASITGPVEKPPEPGHRIQDLERQVADLSERRFEHLESLQQMQMQLQAQLLFMTQSRNHNSHGHTSRPFQISRIPRADVKHPDMAPHRAEFTSYHPSAQSQPTYKPSTHNQPVYGTSTHNQPVYSTSTRNQPTLNPDTISKHHHYLNEVRELQGSHLDTPAPRDRIPKPAPYTLPHEPTKNFGFLQELLARKDNAATDTTFSVMGDYSSPARLEGDRNNSARGKRPDQSPVDKARQLVRSLSHLEKDTADSIWGSRDGLNKMEKMDVDLGPAPLDQYLKYPEKAGSPYPKLGHHSKQKKKLLDSVDNFLEAKNVLRQLETTRLTLEKNIDQVVKSRRDVHMFTTLLGCEADRVNDGQLRIEKLVTKKISALEGDVQRDVLRGLALAEAEKQAAQQELELAARRKLEQGKSAILKGQAERTARLSYSKPNILATATLNNRGKENRGSKVRLPPKPTAIKDEATRVRTYGKPEYQRGRTTIRDPYLHFKNPKKGVAAKSSLTNLNESARSREGRSRSPPRHDQEPIIDPMPRQFYFSPTRGYIPLGGGDTAPIQGQLISMAIPLGAPRLEPGVRRSAVPVTRSSSGPVSSTPVPVTAARNVAMVSFPIDKDGPGIADRQPELTKQVLPPVDIDSISPSSSQRSDIHFRSPQQDNANLTFLFDSRNEADESNLTHTEESSELEQSGEGIKLPGYEPTSAPYSGPSFPPKICRSGPGWAVGAGEVKAGQQMSDVMAEDLRRRDMLENNAVIWLEQELMARALSQIPMQVPEKPADVSRAESQASDKDESLLVTDMIGQSGMQLFIDAGQPVDNALVQELIKDVIREKILAMMAQRETEGEGQVRVRNEVEEAMEEKLADEVAIGSHRVPTPQPTPESSPIPFPKKSRQQPPQPATPPQSPPLDGYRFKPLDPEPQMSPEPTRQPQAIAEPSNVLTAAESESETSLSLDISEELRRVTAKGQSAEVELRVVVCHDVATPPLSPPMVTEEEEPEVFPERQATPPATPPVTKTPPRIRTPSPRRREPVLEKEEEEIEEEERLEQPQPIKISVGVGDDRLSTAETVVQHRSSPPKRPLSPPSTVSETSSSLSTESGTTTDTVNEFISEGQWLLSYSEGQVVGGAVNYEAIRKEIAGRGYDHIVDVSTASTLRDTDDLDLDVEGTRSEGEFLHGGFPDPAKDPRLEVLAQLQKRTAPVRQMHSGPAPQVAMSSTGRSVGEMSIGQVPPSRAVTERARKYEGHLQRGREGRARSPSSTLERNLEDNYTYKNDTQDRRQELEQPYNRSQSPQQDSYSRTASPPQKHRSRTPSPQQQQKRSRTPPQPEHSRTPSPQQQQKRSRTPPQQDRRSKTPPPQQQFARTRAKAQMQYQPVLSEGRPLSARGRTLPGKQGRLRNSDVRLSQTSDPGVRRSGSVYNSESLSRSADSDSFRRSANGFLTSSLKSRNSAIKKSVEFDLSGTQQSSRRASRELSDDMGASLSAALTYTQDSLDEAELHRIAAVTGTSSYAGTYRMSVTIPSGAEGEESEISEVDLSNKSDQ